VRHEILDDKRELKNLALIQGGLDRIYPLREVTKDYIAAMRSGFPIENGTIRPMQLHGRRETIHSARPTFLITPQNKWSINVFTKTKALGYFELLWQPIIH
jgi:hypothetical protein